MKNFRLLIIALAFISVFTACKKDDEKDTKPQTTAQKVLGKWTMKKVAYKWTVDNDVLVDAEENASPGDYIEFNANKSFVVSFDGDVDSGTYEILNDNAMTMTGSDGKATVVIDKLDTKEFNLTSSTSEVIDGSTSKEVFKFQLVK